MRRGFVWALVVPLAAWRALACSSSPSTPDAGGSDASSEGAVTTPAPQQPLRWAKEFGHGAFARDVGVDGAGDIWVGGRFVGPSLDIDSTSVPCAATYCAFVAKFSPAGDLLIAQTLGSGKGDVVALAVTHDAVFAAIDQVAQADAGPLASAWHAVLELDLQGQIVDARTTAVLPTDIGTHATALVTGPISTNVYFFSEVASGKAVRVGTLDGSVADFDAGSDGVLLRTFGAGPFDWGAPVGATPIDLSVARSATGGVLFTGQFPSASLDPELPEIGSLVFDGGKQTGFVAHVDPSGSPAYLENLGGGQPHAAVALANGHLVIVGEVKGDVFVGGVPVTDSGHTSNSVPFWLEVDSSGAVVRASSWAAPVFGVFESVIATADGGTIAAGGGGAYLPQGRIDGDFVVRFDTQGAPMWARANLNVGTGRLHLADTASGPLVVGTSTGTIDLSPFPTDVRDAGDAAIFIAALQP